MTVKVWSLSSISPIRSFEHHSEFVFGLDISIFHPNKLVSASWDEWVCVFDGGGIFSPPRLPSVKQRALLPSVK